MKNNEAVKLLVSDLLYFDRTTDENLGMDEVEKAFQAEEVSVDEMVEAFRVELTERLRIYR